MRDRDEEQVIFDVVSKFDKKIRLTEEKYNHVCTRHPEVFEEKEKMKKTLVSPQIVRRSTYDDKVWLFYRLFEETPVTEKYLMVAVKILNDKGFVVTSYFTDRIKIGEEIWREK